MHRAVQLDHMLTARRLMQPVNILGDHGGQDAHALQFGQGFVGGVGLCVREQHFFAVKAIEFFRIVLEKSMAQNRFRRIAPFLVVQSAGAAEVRDAALRRYARPAKEHRPSGILQHLRQTFHLG